MKLRMLEFLSCPLCAMQPLDLEALETVDLTLSDHHHEKCRAMNVDPATVSKAVKHGVLGCKGCSTWFPIVNFVPVMHRFATRIHDEFAARHPQSVFVGAMRKPSGKGEPGELQTVRNYTKTWETSGVNDLNFYFTHEKIQNIFRACLEWPEWVLKTPNLRTLDVGVGFGYEAKNVQAVLDGETFGVDLNLSLVSSGHVFAEDPFLHLMVCSLFHIPLPKRSFDVVTSMGVLHHTFSTEQAFRSIVRYMKDDGMVLIWLYSNDDFTGNFGQRLREQVFRPIISRLPVWAQTAILWLPAMLHYPVEKRLVPNPEKWKFRNTLHHMRDRYTPIYADRVMFREPIMWMHSLGMECRHLDYVHFLEKIGYWNVGVTCRGVKRGVQRGMTLSPSAIEDEFKVTAVPTSSLLRRVARHIPGARTAWYLMRGARR